jgi:TPP-dependent pyruvate/acetoin dehydrogenase alpha subunit
MTFRFHGHVIGDNDAYMDAGEKAEWMKKDPVPVFRKSLIDEGHATEAALAKMEADIAAEIEEALAFALDSAFPDASELRRDVYRTELAAEVA